MHARWHVGAARFVEVAATLEVLVAPAVPRLYFWALQVGFAGARGGGGAGHTGLQWLPVDGGLPAVNWGGYGADGRELDGTVSPLPSLDGNPNTRLLAWDPSVPHRLRVYRSPEGRGWRAEVDGAVVRDLFGAGEYLVEPMVWSEVFAACDDPPTVVRWSAFEGRQEDGSVVVPDAVTVTYQSWADGGCTNTDASLDGVGVVQATGTPRRTPHLAVLRRPAP
jgi:hypothetical protein